MLLHYKTYGTSGPWIMMVHGLYGSGDNWTSMARSLAPHYQIVLPDLRNHGASPHHHAHNYPELANDLLDTMNHLGIDSAQLLGHSMGGKAVMHLALKYPEKVKKLIVVDIAPVSYTHWLDNKQIENRHDHLINILRAIPISNCLTRQEIEKHAEEYIPNAMLRQFLLKNVKRNEDNTFAWKLNIEALYQNLTEIADGFTNLRATPFTNACLFIRGERSLYIEDKDIDPTRKLFPNARFITIPQAGHWLHAEKPELVLNAINTFING
ncbi:MAG: alpha/beta fold hydrolase [Marinilabiliaceae bacterium]|nr:alpha/beta fold hydrolase [Marinilabiliaceae bacterium]